MQGFRLLLSITFLCTYPAHKKRKKNKERKYDREKTRKQLVIFFQGLCVHYLHPTFPYHLVSPFLALPLIKAYLQQQCKEFLYYFMASHSGLSTSALTSSLPLSPSSQIHIGVNLSIHPPLLTLCFITPKYYHCYQLKASQKLLSFTPLCVASTVRKSILTQLLFSAWTPFNNPTQSFPLFLIKNPTQSTCCINCYIPEALDFFSSPQSVYISGSQLVGRDPAVQHSPCLVVSCCVSQTQILTNDTVSLHLLFYLFYFTFWRQGFSV